jgi:hypothetical protein
MDKIFITAFIISQFPWIGFGFMNLDSQPWPYIAFSIYMLCMHKAIKMSNREILLCVFVFVGMIFSILNTKTYETIDVLRFFYNYTFFFLVYKCVSVYLIKKPYPYKAHLICNVIWILFCAVEYVSPEAKEFFTPLRTSEGRGLTSLAPEPTAFAMYLLMSSMILFAANYQAKSNIFNIYILNILFIIFVAKSSMIILYLGIALVIYILVILLNKRIVLLFISCILTIIFIYTLKIYLEDYDGNVRALSLLNIALNGGGNVFEVDASINSRLEHAVLSIHSSVLNKFLPGGFIGYGEHCGYLIKYYNGFFDCDDIYPMKLNSWIGEYVHTLGIFGIVFVMYFFVEIYKNNYKKIAFNVFIFLLLFSAVALAFPMTPILFAVLKSQRKEFKYKSIFHKN